MLGRAEAEAAAEESKPLSPSEQNAVAQDAWSILTSGPTRPEDPA